MSKIKLWENTLFEKIIAVYDDGTEEEIGYIDEDRNRIYYAAIPTAHPPRKFRSDWNQRQYDAYQKRNNEVQSRNGRSPDFATLLHQQNQKILGGVGIQMHQHSQRVLGGAGNLLARLQPNNNPVKNTTNLMAFLSDTNPKSRTPKVLQTKVLQTNVLKSVINFQELIENQLELIKQLDIITTYQHGARYYIPWLARWTAIDPMEAKYAGMSPYYYAFNNPVMWNDLNGAEQGGDDPDWYIKGVWYSDANKKLKFASGIKDRKEFNSSKYKKNEFIGQSIHFHGTDDWGYDLGNYGKKYPLGKYKHDFHANGKYKITNVKTNKTVLEINNYKYIAPPPPKPPIEQSTMSSSVPPIQSPIETPVQQPTSLLDDIKLLLKKGDDFFASGGFANKWSYKIYAEYNPLVQAQQNLFSGILGRDVTTPTWSDINRTGDYFDGSYLSTQRRITMSLTGVTGYIGLGFGGQSIAIDFLMNASSDYFFNGDVEKTFHFKNTGATVELGYTIYKFKKGKKPTTNGNLIDAGNGYINSLINNAAGATDSKIKEKENQK